MIGGGTVSVLARYYFLLLSAIEHDQTCDCGGEAVPDVLDHCRDQWAMPVAVIVARGVIGSG